MFRYVFGGAIHIPGVVHYVDYLMPGVFAQTVVFGAIQTGIGLAEDLHKGLIERFRSLPMARSAVLVGPHARRPRPQRVRRCALMVVDRLPRRLPRPDRACSGCSRAWRVMLLFGFSLTWIFAIIGLSATNAETAQAASFPILAPLVFASSAFVVGRHRCRAGSRAFAKYQPVSIAIDASAIADARRASTRTRARSSASLAWSVGIIAVFAPLAVRRYRRAA